MSAVDQELGNELYWDKVRQAWATPIEEKILDGPRLFDRSCRLMMIGIRMQHPNADEQQCREILAERLRLLRNVEGHP